MARNDMGQEGIHTRFSSENQPKRRGRKKNIFGKLAKENELSLDDIRNIYKNILTTDYDKLDDLKDQFPCSFVRITIDVFKQETFGTLSGKTFKMVDKKMVDKKDGYTEETKEIQERIKSYRLTRYMLDRIFGSITKVENIEHNGSIITIGLPPSLEETKSN